jgi:hypothetical protein
MPLDDPLTTKRWKVIRQQIENLQNEAESLRKEWRQLQEACAHPNLPERKSGERYMDTCPDCGYLSYCC